MMKRNGRKNLILVIGTFVIALVFVLLLMSPKSLNVEKNTATIRLPGEFSGEAVFYYNSDYVEQSETNSTLTLTFKKQGYYLCHVGKCDYVFKVLNMDNSNYTVDLIREEYQAIWGRLLIERLFVLAAIWVGEFLIYAAIRARLSKRANPQVQTIEVE